MWQFYVRVTAIAMYAIAVFIMALVVIFLIANTLSSLKRNAEGIPVNGKARGETGTSNFQRDLFVYASLWLSSVLLAISAVVETITTTTTEIANFIYENRYTVFVAVAVTLIAALATYYTPEFLFALQLGYNLIALPVRAPIIYTWTVVAIIADAVLPVYNFLVVFMKNAVSSLVTIVFESCEVTCLNIFVSIGVFFEALFGSILVWATANPLQTALDLSPVAGAIGNITTDAFEPVAYLCEDLNYVFLAVDAPLHGTNFAGLLTSVAALPISTVQQIAVSAIDRSTFTTAPIWTTFIYMSGNLTGLLDDYVNSFYHVFVNENASFASVEYENPFSPLRLTGENSYALESGLLDRRRKRSPHGAIQEHVTEVFQQAGEGTAPEKGVYQKRRPYTVGSVTPPARLPPLFQSIIGNAISAVFSLFNITTEALINTKSVLIQNDGPVKGNLYLNGDPFFNYIYGMTQGIYESFAFIADALQSISNPGPTITPLVYFDLISQEFLLAIGGTARHAVNSVLLLIQSIYNTVIHVVYAAFQAEPDFYEVLVPIWLNTVHTFNISGSLVTTVVPSPVFNELRFMAQSVASVVTFFHVPTGCLLRSAINVFLDFLQLIIQFLLSVVQMITTSLSPTSPSLIPFNVTLILADAGVFSSCLGDLIKEFSADCDPFLAIGDSNITFPCSDSGNVFDVIGYNAYCDASYQQLNLGAQCCASISRPSDLACVVGQLFQDLSDTLFTTLLIPIEGNNATFVVSAQLKQIDQLIINIGYSFAYAVSDEPIIVDLGPVVTSLLNITTIPLYATQSFMEASIQGGGLLQDLTTFIVTLLRLIFNAVIQNARSFANWCSNFSEELQAFFTSFAVGVQEIEQEFAEVVAEILQFLMYSVMYFMSGQWNQLFATFAQFAETLGDLVAQAVSSLAVQIWNQLKSVFLPGVLTAVDDVCNVLNDVLRVLFIHQIDCSSSKRSPEDFLRNVISQVLLPSGLISAEAMENVAGNYNDSTLSSVTYPCSAVFDEMYLKSYMGVEWKNVELAERAWMLQCLRYVRQAADVNYMTVLYMQQLQATGGEIESLTNYIPLDVLYNTNAFWSVFDDVVRALFVRTEYYLSRNFYSEATVHGAQYMEYCHENNISMSLDPKTCSLQQFYQDSGVLYGWQVEMVISEIAQRFKNAVSNMALHYSRFAKSMNVYYHQVPSEQKSVRSLAHVSERFFKSFYTSQMHLETQRRNVRFSSDRLPVGEQRRSGPNRFKIAEMWNRLTPARRHDSDVSMRGKSFKQSVLLKESADHSRAHVPYNKATANWAGVERVGNLLNRFITPPMRSDTAALGKKRDATLSEGATCTPTGGCVNCRIADALLEIIVQQSNSIASYYKVNFLGSIAYYRRLFNYVATGLDSQQDELNGIYFPVKNGLPFIELPRIIPDADASFNKTTIDVEAFRGQQTLTTTASSTSRTTAHVSSVDTGLSTVFANFSLIFYIDAAASFLFNPNASSNQSALYYFDAATTCSYESTLTPISGVGFIGAIVIVIATIVVLWAFALLPQCALVFLIALSPGIVLFVAYFYSPQCLPALPVYVFDDISVLLNISLPRCILQDATTTATASEPCNTVPPRQRFLTATQAGFDDWQDNVVFAIETYSPGFANLTLSSTTFNFTASGTLFPLLRALLTTESLTKYANMTTATPTQVLYFYLTIGHVLVLLGELSLIAVAATLLVIPLASAFLLAFGNVAIQTVFTCSLLWSCIRAGFVDNTNVGRDFVVNEPMPETSQGAGAGTVVSGINLPDAFNAKPFSTRRFTGHRRKPANNSKQDMQ